MDHAEGHADGFVQGFRHWSLSHGPALHTRAPWSLPPPAWMPQRLLLRPTTTSLPKAVKRVLVPTIKKKRLIKNQLEWLNNTNIQDLRCILMLPNWSIASIEIWILFLLFFLKTCFLLSLKSVHFKETVAQSSFLSKLWYFSKQQVSQFWKKWGSRNCLLKV